MRSRSTQICALLFLGSFLAQVAWILAVPPFRGVDEFDHAYRAAAVADGHWMPTGETSPKARGEIVRVPAGIVRDAEPNCSALTYTGPGNCKPIERFADGTVTVASAAAKYNPIFYSVIGTAAKPFDGAHSLYVMRLVGALLCSLVFAATAWTITRWARTIWPIVSLCLITTPVVLYSSTVAAPNGLELYAGAGFAFALLALDRVSEADRGRFLVLATIFATVLTTLRGLGPLWVLLIALVALAQLTPKVAYSILRSRPGTAITGIAVVGVASAAAAWWTLHYGSMDLEAADVPGNAFLGTLGELPLWFLQSIAAFPLRNEPAPMPVYAAGIVAIGGLLVLGYVAGRRRDRLVLLGSVALSIAVPFALQWNVYNVAGTIWQGRYGWPLSLVVLVLAGLALDSRPVSRALAPSLLLAAALAWEVAQVWSNVPIDAAERGGGEMAGDPRWISVSPWIVGMLTAAGIALWAVAATRASKPRRVTAHVGESTGDPVDPAAAEPVAASSITVTR
jgi:hypothetical protein